MSQFADSTGPSSIQVQQAGHNVSFRETLNFMSGATIRDNVAKNRTDIVIDDAEIIQLDGGFADSIYLLSQGISGGNASSVYTQAQMINCGYAQNFDLTLDGGSAISLYGLNQNVPGGAADSVYLSTQHILGGSA